jgi:hypothetical protein
MILFESANAGLLIAIAILAGAVIVLSFIGLLMKRAGVSLKPLYWFVGFMLLILLPQLAGHFVNARMRARAVSSESRITIAAPVTLAPDFDYRDAQKLFGKRSTGILVVDGRATASGLLHPTDNPKLFILPGGETLLVGRFASSSQANDAVTQYLMESRLVERARADGAGGFIAERGPADFVYARAYGDLFTAWSGPSSDAIEQLRIAANVQTSSRSVSPRDTEAEKAEWLDDIIWRASASWTGLAMLLGVFAGYLLLITAYFFKGIAWATRVKPRASANPLSTAALGKRLLAINSLDVPFRVETGKSANELVASWRYADVKWIDHARAHGMRRLHRIVLELDEPKRKVRATDFATAFDWSAGGSDAALNWKFVTGVVFFQYEHQRVFGIQLDEHGQFKAAFPSSYTFNLQEMKAPLTAAITQAGWTWQPVAWKAPNWLKWLTE